MLDLNTFEAIFNTVLCPGDAFARQYFPELAVHMFRKYQIAATFRPRSIVEFGVRAGYSGWALSKGATDTGVVPTYVGFDSDIDQNGPVFVSHARKIISTVAGAVEIRQADTRKLVPADIPKADLVHVDADHSYAGALHEISIASGAASPGGVVVSDDFDYMLDVRRAVLDFLSANPRWFAMHVESWRGEAILVKPR